jgi:phosphohistidine phosphatase
MDRLILLRHGKAEAGSASGKDFDRALTDRGRRDALIVAQALDRAGVRPDLVLVSPAARAAQTWAAMAEVFPAARVEHAAALYDISPDALLQLARSEAGGAGAVMVVGHNPGLGQLAAWLAQSAPAGPGRLRIVEGFPTAAAAVIGFAPPAFDLYTPKGLGGGA